jgi:hypothetical protein
MKPIDFKTSFYFPSSINLAGIVFFAAGVPILMVNLIIGIALCIVSVAIFTTHYRLRIDMKNKTYLDYLWIIGFKVGEEAKFDTIQYLFIKKSIVSQTMHARVASSTIRKEVFDGYLKFSDTDKLHIETKESKDALMKKLNVISGLLNTTVIDYSEA